MHIRIPKVRVVVPHIHITPAMRSGDRPGPDSAQVGAFLTAMGQAEPTVCEMAVDQLGNSWGRWGGGAPGGLRDRTDADRAARDRFGGSVADSRAVPLLGATLGDQNPCVRRAAARLLGSSTAAEALPRLRAAATSDDARVREAALLGLGEADDAESYDAMLRGLRDRDPYVSRMGAWALGTLHIRVRCRR
jgi:hypothetical protein